MNIADWLYQQIAQERIYKKLGQNTEHYKNRKKILNNYSK
jgi:hypothetical protein